ncbi:MAG: deoxynucleoside kinase [Saprospiraceae bacterium]|nr:deoxynucleoside kinase [Saprospiraceae bacterium]MCB9311162.1 deoxynucleoside kinase [Lewinellaceae bacterium]HRW75175.1 deoxynucleoside kinase [Saprospiraceae bacterium]
MSQPEIPYSYVAIEGNIGSGKTTLSEMMARDYECNLILEQFADNPFLPYFYEDAQRYGFPLELFFMTERYKQLQALGTQQDLFYNFHIADYTFIKTLLFARNNLPQDEFRIFQKLYQTLEASLPKPDLIVYLHRPIEILLSQIAKRGRSYELQIKAEYLRQIQQVYFEYFRSETVIPILIFDMQDANLHLDQSYYEEILRMISRDHRPGIQHIRIH